MNALLGLTFKTLLALSLLSLFGLIYQPLAVFSVAPASVQLNS